MKKLSIILLCAVTLGLMFENTSAHSFNSCNFFLEHDRVNESLERFTISNDEWSVPSEDRPDMDVFLHASPEFIPRADSTDEDKTTSNVDGFDVNLMHVSQKMERFVLNLKMSKADSVCEERNDYYFKGMNYSIALSYNF